VTTQGKRKKAKGKTREAVSALFPFAFFLLPSGPPLVSMFPVPPTATPG
jgi:hypothetical protein